MLAMLGMRDIHAMGAIRTLLAVAINAAAVVTFIVAGAVLWPQCAVMIAGSLDRGLVRRALRAERPTLESAGGCDRRGHRDERVFLCHSTLACA